MALWLKDYGISAMLTPVKEKQQRTRKLGKKIHEGLNEGLSNLQEGFLSYVSAQQWVEET